MLDGERNRCGRGCTIVKILMSCSSSVICFSYLLPGTILKNLLYFLAASIMSIA